MQFPLTYIASYFSTHLKFGTIFTKSNKFLVKTTGYSFNSGCTMLHSYIAMYFMHIQLYVCTYVSFVTLDWGDNHTKIYIATYLYICTYNMMHIGTCKLSCCLIDYYINKYGYCYFTLRCLTKTQAMSYISCMVWSGYICFSFSNRYTLYAIL